ncbi:uncharacterized protein LOC141905616 [Tubulanus polymorphus]|uniref:uncharacterized protein LOC141905616 n=1 Tax=Tubulanus polymorphus TaxID=672921 RepID=UPI003DA20D67
MRSFILFALVCLAVFCFFEQSEARFRCRRYCRFRCGFRGCRLVCGVRCSFRGKRDVTGDDTPAANTTAYKHDTPIPPYLNYYDVNDDGKISVDEFASALEIEDEDARFMIKQADKNGDMLVDESEFKTAPWPFAKPDKKKCDCKNGSKTPAT